MERGLERRGACEPRRIGLDETSFKKRHEYVTVVTDLDGRRVLSVLDGRTRDSVDAHFSALPAHARASPSRWWRWTCGGRTWMPRRSGSLASMRPERRTLLSQLKDVCTRTGRAWALKEMAAKLWDYASVGWARNVPHCGQQAWPRCSTTTSTLPARTSRRTSDTCHGAVIPRIWA